MLFLSKNAVFNETAAIRGGIPICWPQFGPGNLPQHGFARNQNWQLVSAGKNVRDNTVEMTLRLHDTDHSRSSVWGDNKFTVNYMVTLTDDRKLRTELHITNNNTAGAFEFTTALHTYFAVKDIRNVAIEGLHGCKYVDSMRDKAIFEETNEKITFAGETDRKYLNAPSVIKICEDGSPLVMINKIGFHDAVVWNPWTEKAKKMADFGDDEWLNMVCVEAAIARVPVRLDAGQSWSGYQEITSLAAAASKL
eukprot:GEZU01005269.1.p1 GENE.GEZU01005269.1~~GEZU01005269.1.p1  ORF type:complete len:251 (-),score=60.33 GEZU01005269.1:46-798(-)